MDCYLRDGLAWTSLFDVLLGCGRISSSTNTTTITVTTTTSLSHAIFMIKNVAIDTRNEKYLEEMLHHSCMKRGSSTGNRRNKGEGYGAPLTRGDIFVGWRSSI